MTRCIKQIINTNQTHIEGLYTAMCIIIKGEKRMHKNKTAIAIAIAILLTFAMAVSLIALPTANAQTSGSKKTYAYIGAVPNPAGVGQQVLKSIVHT